MEVSNVCSKIRMSFVCSWMPQRVWLYEAGWLVSGSFSSHFFRFYIGKARSGSARFKLVSNLVHEGKKVKMADIKHFNYNCACPNPFSSWVIKSLHESGHDPLGGWPVSRKRASSASEPTRFQLLLNNRNFDFKQSSSRRDKLCLK